MPSAKTIPVLFTFVFLLTILIGSLLGIPKFVPNSEMYLNMAQGHAEQVVKPFSARILHPVIARVLIVVGLTAETAFTLLALAALGLLMLSVGFTVRWFGHERAFWPVLLFCPILIEYYRTAYMNDLFHAALVAALCVALLRAEMLVLPILLALQLCRESTILVAFVLLLYFVWEKKYPYAVGTLVTVALGFFIVSRVSAGASHNIHSLSTASYIGLKSAWNFLANWLGLRLWRPTFEWPCPTPLLSTKVPLIGDQLTICDWHWEFIVTTWTNFLGTLSLSFAFVLVAWKAGFASLDRKRSKLLLTIATYGVLAGVVGTFTGTATHRLVGYGWPLIWIVVPVLFNTVLRTAGPLWLGLHWALMWIRAAIPKEWIWLEIVFSAAMIGLNVWAYRRLTASKQKATRASAPARSQVAVKLTG